MSTTTNQPQNEEYGKYALELFTLFAPLALQLPLLRDDPALMHAAIKKTGQNGVNDVVTGADLYMQKRIKEEVAKIHPDWQFWGEEGNDNTFEYQEGKPYVVITDPIEGTNNFVAKIDDQ